MLDLGAFNGNHFQGFLFGLEHFLKVVKLTSLLKDPNNMLNIVSTYHGLKTYENKMCTKGVCFKGSPLTAADLAPV